MKKPLEKPWVSLQIEWSGFKGITRVAHSVSEIDGETDIAPVSSVGGGLGKMASASTFAWQKTAPPALGLKPDNSVPRHMF